VFDLKLRLILVEFLSILNSSFKTNIFYLLNFEINESFEGDCFEGFKIVIIKTKGLQTLRAIAIRRRPRRWRMETRFRHKIRRVGSIFPTKQTPNHRCTPFAQRPWVAHDLRRILCPTHPGHLEHHSERVERTTSA
jgi:hypothetical protein